MGPFICGDSLCAERLCGDAGCSVASSLDLVDVTAFVGATIPGVDACAVNAKADMATVAAIATMERLLRRVLTDITFALCC